MTTTTTQEAAAPAGLIAIPGRMLCRRDLAEMFNVAPESISNWARAGKLPKPVLVGKRRFWRPEVVREFLNAQGHEAMPA